MPQKKYPEYKKRGAANTRLPAIQNVTEEGFSVAQEYTHILNTHRAVVKLLDKGGEFKAETVAEKAGLKEKYRAMYYLRVLRDLGICDFADIRALKDTFVLHYFGDIDEVVRRIYARGGRYLVNIPVLKRGKMKDHLVFRAVMEKRDGSAHVRAANGEYRIAGWEGVDEGDRWSVIWQLGEKVTEDFLDDDKLSRFVLKHAHLLRGQVQQSPDSPMTRLLHEAISLMEEAAKSERIERPDLPLNEDRAIEMTERLSVILEMLGGKIDE